MLRYFIFCCFLVVCKLPAYAQACGGLLDYNTGNLDIEPINLSCVWILKLQNMTGVSLQLEQPTVEPIFAISDQVTSDTNPQSVWTIGTNKTQNFNGKTLAIVAPPCSLKRTLNWSGMLADDTSVSSIAKYESSPKGNLEWQHSLDGTEKIFWAVEFKSNGQLNWTLDSVLPQCGFTNPCERISFTVFKVLQGGNLNETVKTCDGSSVGSLDMETNSTALILLHVNSPLAASSKLKVAWRSYGKVLTDKDDQTITTEQTNREGRGILIDKEEQTSSTGKTHGEEREASTDKEDQTSTTSKINSEERVNGILAGTVGGLFVISFNGSHPFNISSKPVRGLAFDRSSKKVYWSEENVAIFRANLDGSNREVLLEVGKVVWAMAIEPITRNLYYSTSGNEVNLCNNDAQEGTIIANSSEKYHVYEFAFHLSKRLVFWSLNGIKVVRSKLDGSDKTEILQRRVAGLVVDETEDRLYWAFYSPKEIGSCDLNGEDIRFLPDISINASDIEFDNNKIYFSQFNSSSIYRMTRQATDLALVANLTYKVHFVNFFG